MKKYDTFGERLLACRLELELTQDELAAKAGLTRMAISKIELGMTQKPRTDNLFALAKALEVDVQWLASGKGDKKASKQSVNKTERNQLSEYSSEAIKVPLIQWGEIEYFINNKEAQLSEFLFYPFQNSCGINCFALKVNDSSMLPRFDVGDIIYIDPELINPNDSDFILVRPNKKSQIALKEFKNFDGIRYFSALNPDYPVEIKHIKETIDSEYIGTIICHIKCI